jgi:hypothetical protein
MTAYRQAKLRVKDVPNPSYMPAHDGERWNPRKVGAMVNVRESAVASLEARGQLDECQVKTADVFRSHWEAMGGVGTRAIDYTKEPVDGGRNVESYPERRAAAGKELKRCRDLLGARNYDLVCKVCGQGMSFRDLASSRRDRDTLADNLRASLDDLAVMWKLARQRASV